MSSNNEYQKSFQSLCFKINNVFYMPHYTKNCFVGPGYGRQNLREYSQDELLVKGAKARKIEMWTRPRVKS
jgi:hypothetical protein